MFGAVSTDAPRWLSPLARRAAAGELPEWTCASPARRAHIERVVSLLDAWAAELSLSDGERERWRAVGALHDVLKDVDQEELRKMVPEPLSEAPAPLLHGPAAAEKLAGELDPAALDAIRYHTIGHPDLDAAGRALFMADYLEPGRTSQAEFRASLRARMPQEAESVLVEVAAARVKRLVDRRQPLRVETVDFWAALVGSGR